MAAREVHPSHTLGSWLGMLTPSLCVFVSFPFLLPGVFVSFPSLLPCVCFFPLLVCLFLFLLVCLFLFPPPSSLCVCFFFTLSPPCVCFFSLHPPCVFVSVCVFLLSLSCVFSPASLCVSPLPPPPVCCSSLCVFSRLVSLFFLFVFFHLVPCFFPLPSGVVSRGGVQGWCPGGCPGWCPGMVSLWTQD